MTIALIAVACFVGVFIGYRLGFSRAHALTVTAAVKTVEETYERQAYWDRLITDWRNSVTHWQVLGCAEEERAARAQLKDVCARARAYGVNRSSLVAGPEPAKLATNEQMREHNKQVRTGLVIPGYPPEPGEESYW